MTRRGKLQTLEMALKEDQYEEDFDGLMEGGFSVKGWDEEADFEEEEDESLYEAPKKSKSKKKSDKPHILDRTRNDGIIYGGFVRHHFYKEHGGKKPLTLTNDPSTAEITCRDCSTTLAETLDKSNLFGSLHFSEIYFRTQDEFNRELPELTLALLQLFDWVGICSCGEVHYGYLKIVDVNTLPQEPVIEEPKVEMSPEPIVEETASEVSLKDRVQQFALRAENMTAKSSEEPEIETAPTSNKKKKMKHTQLSIFNFLEEEELEAVGS